MVKEKNMSEYTTKQLTVPAKYFLQTIAADKITPYPVSLVILSKIGGGISYRIDNTEELISICHSKAVYESGVIYACRKKGRWHIELKEDGRFVVEKAFLPQKSHMGILDASEVARLYDQLIKGQ